MNNNYAIRKPKYKLSTGLYKDCFTQNPKTACIPYILKTLRHCLGAIQEKKPFHQVVSDPRD